MALLTVPLDENAPWYSFTLALEGVTYTFELAFNVRSGRWYLSLGDVLGNAVVSGIPLLIERDLLAPYRTSAVPPGNLVVIDDSGQGEQPGLGSFLLDHSLYYVESTT